MKAYIVLDKSNEHNPVGSKSGKPVKVFRTREGADAECSRYGSAHWDFRYNVTEVEVGDDDVALSQALGTLVRAKMLEGMQSEFLAGCRALFRELPTLHSFGWEQFPEDDPELACALFGTTRLYPDINGIDGLVVEGKTSPEDKLQRQVASFLTAFEQEDVLFMFGYDTHGSIYVTVYRDGRVETRME